MSDTTTGHGPAGADPSGEAEAVTEAVTESAPEAISEITAEIPAQISAAVQVEVSPGTSGDTATSAPAQTPEGQATGGGESADGSASASDPDSHRFECRSCGFVYDPAEGIRKLAIEAGTPFSALDPVSFRCPVCRSKTLAFRDIGPRNKPSGFEENLNFGLGVNRLTPGQKNVLIFGGFALAFAFFLSLYSLR